ncbi:hypothetical protein ACB288_22300, partial [Aeromonas taiwanensis]
MLTMAEPLVLVLIEPEPDTSGSSPLIKPVVMISGVVLREFNFEVQFPIKNQAAFRSSSKTTCGCLNPKHLRGLKFSR